MVDHTYTYFPENHCPITCLLHTRRLGGYRTVLRTKVPRRIEGPWPHARLSHEQLAPTLHRTALRSIFQPEYLLGHVAADVPGDLY